MQLSQTLKALRLRQNMGARTVARKLDVSRAFIQQIEAGTLVPSDARLAQLASIYDTDADYLILLAGRVPKDVAAILINEPNLLTALRSSQSSR
jgi:transcriptional regulator with XRE-family HTH domain